MQGTALIIERVSRPTDREAAVVGLAWRGSGRRGKLRCCASLGQRHAHVVN